MTKTTTLINVPNEIALLHCEQGKAVLIDVREKIEFDEGSLKGAINLASSSAKVADFDFCEGKSIYLVCQTGNRARTLGQMLLNAGVQEVGILEKHMEQLKKQDLEVSADVKSWTVDRQFRMALGLMLLVGLLGYLFISNYFLIIPGILCAGLIVTALIDRCYMRMGIAMLPWNKGKKV
jgi:rhodanese-related sulfurtransferase